MNEGKEVQKWADEAMFKAETSDASKGPQVYLVAASSDPLGQIAAAAKMYKGEVVRNLSDVTRAEREYYLEEMKKTKLKMPLEAVSMHFMIEGVTRGFTHQMVRQRTAAYAQESMRFAVKEDLASAVALPPSLSKYNEPSTPPEWEDYPWTKGDDLIEEYGGIQPYSEEFDRILDQDVKNYLVWRYTVAQVSRGYMYLVNNGQMPAEDARGLTPTNITTRLNYITNLRGLLDHAGNRLCTQAQFEWRIVFAQIAKAMRSYNFMDSRARSYENPDPNQMTIMSSEARYMGSQDMWQWNAIADLLQPICYQTGKCEFKADFDRKCSIRSRVDANAEIGRSSTEWSEPWAAPEYQEMVEKKGHPGIEGVAREKDTGRVTFLGPIQPREWLADPAAAR